MWTGDPRVARDRWPDSSSTGAGTRVPSTKYKPDQVAQQGENSPDQERKEHIKGADDGEFTEKAVEHFEEDKRGAGRVDVDAVAEHGFSKFGLTVDFAEGDEGLATLHQIRRMNDSVNVGNENSSTGLKVHFSNQERGRTNLTRLSNPQSTTPAQPKLRAPATSISAYHPSATSKA